MISAARQWAYDILARVATEGSYANVSLQEALRKGALSDRDRALCTTIVYGTLQRQRSLDLMLQGYASRRLDTLDARVLVNLRMTAYQVLYLDKIPAYAALNDAVELCKRVQPKAAGLVNAVIRALLRDGRPVQERLRVLTNGLKDWAEARAIEFSYPTWLVRRWAASFGRDRTLRLLAACNEAPDLSVRVNPLRASRDDVLADIDRRYGPIAKPSLLYAQGIRFTKGLDVSQWDAYLDGHVTVQDEGAMVVAPLLRPDRQARILDLCAAPGGKTTHIAELQGDAGSVVACDLHANKLHLVAVAADRLDLHSIRTEAGDARLLPERAGWRESFDAVLLDAPCSGFGVLRHRPEIRWQRTEQDVRQLAALQAELLASAVRLVRPGGVIVYSTCTLLADENDAVVSTVAGDTLSRVVMDEMTGELPAVLAGIERPDPAQLLLTPDLFGTDGFYMARLRKL